MLLSPAKYFEIITKSFWMKCVYLGRARLCSSCWTWRANSQPALLVMCEFRNLTLSLSACHIFFIFNDNLSLFISFICLFVYFSFLLLLSKHQKNHTAKCFSSCISNISTYFFRFNSMVLTLYATALHVQFIKTLLSLAPCVAGFVFLLFGFFASCFDCFFLFEFNEATTYIQYKINVDFFCFKIARLPRYHDNWSTNTIRMHCKWSVQLATEVRWSFHEVVKLKTENFLLIFDRNEICRASDSVNEWHFQRTQSVYIEMLVCFCAIKSESKINFNSIGLIVTVLTNCLHTFAQWSSRNHVIWGNCCATIRT